MGKLIAEVEATYYGGKGLPYVESQRMAQALGGMDTADYLKYIERRVGGFYTRRYRTDSDVTPKQHEGDNLSDELQFGFGRANVVTNHGKLQIPISDVEIDEWTPGVLVDIHRTTNDAGEREQYILAEFVYREVDEDDHRDERDEAPAPEPSPSDGLPQPEPIVRESILEPVLVPVRRVAVARVR